MTVAAVVVTYERKALLRQCLVALQAQTRPVAEIIVVDNASTDGTAAMVRSAFPDVTLRVLAENRGGAGGFREGMKIAARRGADWIWVMDDDAEPAEDALEQLLAPGLHENPDTTALASLKINSAGEVQQRHVGDYDPAWMAKTPVWMAETEPRPVEYSSFVGLMIRRHAVETVGLPEAGFFIWGDDVEYSLRLSTAGSIYLVSESVVVHHNEFAQERAQVRSGPMGWRNRPIDQFWRKYYELRNPLLILHQHVGSPAHRAIGYGVAAYRALRAAVAVLAVDEAKAVRLHVIAAAFWHGLQGLTGPYVDPRDFPERTHPDVLVPFVADWNRETERRPVPDQAEESG